MIPDILQFPLALVWGIGLLLVLFRRGAGIPWKLAALLLFVFYVVWFRELILQGKEDFQLQFGTSILLLLSTLWQEIGRTLMLLWPVLLFMIFFLASDRSASYLLRLFVILTLFYWLFYFLFLSLPEDWYRPYVEMLPQRLEMPALPVIENLDTDLE